MKLTDASASTESDYDVVVIGGGVAGLSAAMMLGRSRRRTLVLDTAEPRNRFSAQMHAVLGSDGDEPTALLAKGHNELEQYGVEFRAASVTTVTTDDHGVAVSVEGTPTPITARAVIATTGVRDELPDVPGLRERWGISVIHCPYCHGWEVRDRALGVIFTSPMSVHHVELARQLSDRVTAFVGGYVDPVTETANPIELSTTERQRLMARGVVLVDAPVAAVHGPGNELTEIELSDGQTVAVDAVFVASRPVLRADFLDSLDLPRTSTPMGEMLEVNPMGQTSNPRVFAAGNLINLAANVPVSMGSGSFAGAGANAYLAGEDFNLAATPDRFWENRYRSTDRSWSGKVNPTLAAVIGDEAPGRSLDLGSGEGADVLWLAGRGWAAEGVDISATAVRRSQQAAEDAGVRNASYATVDLTSFDPADSYDLVTASFFHSPVALERTAILQRAAGWVAPGGRLVIVSHQPSENGHGPGRHADLIPLPEELASLQIDPQVWASVRTELVPRTMIGPDGDSHELVDGVIELRRHPATAETFDS